MSRWRTAVWLQVHSTLGGATTYPGCGIVRIQNCQEMRRDRFCGRASLLLEHRVPRVDVLCEEEKIYVALMLQNLIYCCVHARRFKQFQHKLNIVSTV
ncbi:unnamed protein product [Amoebophrya sp. A25]|nr:unnamed protein product [Amoebophrya sp. A25]|eukprot:GSA25T00004416001.1